MTEEVATLGAPTLKTALRSRDFKARSEPLQEAQKAEEIAEDITVKACSVRCAIQGWQRARYCKMDGVDEDGVGEGMLSVIIDDLLAAGERLANQTGSELVLECGYMVEMHASHIQLSGRFVSMSKAT